MYFIIRKTTDNQYYFIIKSENQKVIVTSKIYTTKHSVMQTINSIKNGIGKDSLIIDITK